MRSVRLAILVLLAAALTAPAGAAEVVRHVVLRDGQPVGNALLRFERDGDRLVVTSDVTVRVGMGFLTLYEYRHVGREVWQGDRLIALDTETDDNGRHLAVSGRSVGNGFRVEGSDGVLMAPADIRPTSFWREDAVAQPRLLDTETGRVLDIVTTPMNGPDSSQAGRTLHRYRLSGQLKHQLDLTYADGRLISARLRKLGSDIEFRADGAGSLPQLATAGTDQGG